MKVTQVPANAGYGGMPLHVLTLSIGLAERGHEVTVVCMSDGPMVNEYRRAGLDVTVVPLLGRRLGSDPRKILRAVRFLRGVLTKTAPDLVHTHGPRASFFAAMSMRGASRVPLVATAHGSFTQFTAGNKEGFGRLTRLRKQWQYKGVDRLTGHFVDRFIAVSEATRRDLIGEVGVAAGKVVVIRNGIEERIVDRQRRQEVRRELGFDDAQQLVAFVGRIAHHKGVGFLAAAAEMVLAHLPSARFILVGEGPMEAELRQLATKEPFAGRFILTGRRIDALEIVAASDLFVLPSLSEGLPLTLLEAAMLGKAMVSTDVGGCDEVVRDGATGLLVSPGDSGALARAMIRLLEDPDGLDKMGGNARQLWQREFTAERMVDRTEELYAEITGK